MPEMGEAQPQAAGAALQARLDQGVVLHRQGKLADAERCYEEVLRRQPDHFSALHLLGVIARQTRRTERAVELIKKAVRLNPNVAVAYGNLGNALRDLNRPAEALASYDRAIALKPDYAAAHNNRGAALRDLKRPAEALASYDKTIALMPDIVEAHSNRGNALMDLKRPEEALASYDKAIVLKPDYASAHSNRGNAQMELKRPTEALASCDRAIALKPDYAAAHYNRGNALMDLKRPAEALASLDRTIALKPDFEFLYGALIHMKMMICDWSNLENQIIQLVHKIEHAEKVSQPFPLLAATNSPELQRKAAEIYALAKYPLSSALPKIAKRQRRNKVCIAYVSADFRQHPVSNSIVGLLEALDRARFDVIGISLGSEDPSEIGQRIKRAFSTFIDASRM